MRIWSILWLLIYRALYGAELKRYKIYLKIAAVALAIWTADCLILTLMDKVQGTAGFPFFETVKRFATRWDSNSFARIAENWYVTEGNDRYLIVFPPLYPAIVRAVHFITGLDFWISGLATSMVCSVISGMVLFEILIPGSDEKTSFYQVVLYYLYPFSFFFFTGMSEGLYLLLLLLFVCFFRLGRYISAGLSGFLCALTRLPGIALIMPAAVFFVIKAVEAAKQKELRKHIYDLAGSAAAALMTVLGFIVYLLLNYALFGDPMQFIVYEQENWGQHMTDIFTSIKTVAGFQLLSADIYGWGFVAGVAVPNLLAFITGLSLTFWCAVKKKYPEAVYSAVYTYFSLSVSWLLSGGRYSLGMYPLYMMTEGAVRKRKLMYILMAVFAVLHIAACMLYISNQIY